MKTVAVGYFILSRDMLQGMLVKRVSSEDKKKLKMHGQGCGKRGVGMCSGEPLWLGHQARHLEAQSWPPSSSSQPKEVNHRTH